MDHVADKPRKLSWWTPRWSAVRDFRRVMPLVFGWRPLLRITVVSVCVGGGICLAALMAFPQLPLGFLWQAIFGIPGVLAYLAVMSLLQIVIRNQVTVTPERIAWTAGQSPLAFKREEIVSARLVVFDADHIQLMLRTAERRKTLAMSARVDLQQLTGLLKPTDVLDRRAAFQAARELVAQRRHPARRGHSEPDEWTGA